LLVLCQNVRIVFVGIGDEIVKGLFEILHIVVRDVLLYVVQEDGDHLVDREEIDSGVLNFLQIAHDVHKVFQGYLRFFALLRFNVFELLQNLEGFFLHQAG
jgi:hypothetical protein